MNLQIEYLSIDSCKIKQTIWLANKRCLILLLLISVLPIQLIGQDNTVTDTTEQDQPYTSTIQVLAKAYEDSVVLRWAPDEPGGWVYGNRFGYIIERTTLQPEDTAATIDSASYQKIHSDTLKPWPLDKWAEIADEEVNNPYTSIAAQVLYADDKADSLAWIEAADYLETRYSFAMMAADLSPEAANALALRYVDKDIEEGKYYAYRVISPVDPDLYTLIPGYVFVNASNIQPTPAPEIDEAVELENKVEIRWDRALHDQYFSAYYIEKSENEDGPFKRLTDRPYIQPNTDGLEDNKQIIFTDSTLANYQPHYYRIRGLTPFGEISPPSEVVQAMGRDRTPPPAPTNVQTEMLDTTRIKITWEMPSVPADIDGFYVARSREANEGFEPLFDDPLPPGTRSYVDDRANQHISNFYMVGVVDTAGNGNLSLIEYGKMIDQFPPSKPTGFTGKIDTSGIVHLSWDKGPEEDIMGYQIYFANDTTHEFSPLTEGIWQDTTFTDSITVKTLTEEIYYKVLAVDLVYHYSEFSDVLELKKPDIIPPTTPVFNNYEVSEDGIRMDWFPSSSEDVVRHELFRKSDTGDWQMLASVDSSDQVSEYLDEQVEADNIYTYSLMAVDDDSNRSQRSSPLRLKMISFSKKPVVDSLTVTPAKDSTQITLDWDYTYDGDYRFVLYRAVNGSKFVSYESLGMDETQFNDSNVKSGNKYEYAIRVIYADGRKSGFGSIGGAEL